jgi:biopolymer transport protein ExbB
MMDGLMTFAAKYYLIDAGIVAMGFFGIYVMVERWKALYFDLSLDTPSLMKSVMSLLQEDKREEAITLCTANEKKPVAYILKRILEKSDQDENDVMHTLGTAFSEAAPKISKNLAYLPMISNVVTLIGLLGTVVGLIMAFQAVAFADVSQKQTLLANGISLAMHATALGLLVAIPVMVIYSFLHDKQSKIFGDMDRSSAQVLEFLKNKPYEALAATWSAVETAKPNAKKVVPPPAPSKAS